MTTEQYKNKDSAQRENRTYSTTFGSAVSNAHSKEIQSSGATYVMSPAVDGKPYSSKRRIKSPNCP